MIREDHGGHGRGIPGGHDQEGMIRRTGGHGRGFPGGHDQADHGGHGRGFPGGHDQADHGGHGRGFPGGHDQADYGGHGRGFPGGHDQADHGGPGAVNPFWSPEVQQRVALSRVPPGGFIAGASGTWLWRRSGSGGPTEKTSSEETFEREVMRLQAARAGDDVSYKTASDGGATGVRCHRLTLKL